jgi:hypothetical protein
VRGDIGHLQDRGKHSNEREYAALTEIWEKFCDLHEAANSCVCGFLRLPDLQRMNDDEIAKLLDKNEFTEEERDAVRNAANKNDGFSLAMNMRLGVRARSAYRDFRVRLLRQNVFIPKSLADSFGEAADECKSALLLRNPGVRGPDELDFLATSPGTLAKLNDAVRARLLHRE